MFILKCSAHINKIKDNINMSIIVDDYPHCLFRFNLEFSFVSGRHKSRQNTDLFSSTELRTVAHYVCIQVSLIPDKYYIGRTAEKGFSIRYRIWERVWLQKCKSKQSVQHDQWEYRLLQWL
jgi:hypothetical protein